MKQFLSVVVFIVLANRASAQITITSTDMPVAGDTLRYSFASPVGAAISPADSGADIAWNYSLVATRQAVDTYKTALQVNVSYILTVGLTAFGYKVADSIPGVGAFLPVSINNIYTFFEEKTGPSRFIAKAFAANISGIPAPSNYTTPDVWYYFPLAYQNYDSSGYALNISIPTLGGLKETGYRKTRVDGWGTITTPYYTTPVSCIRVRSEIHEIDTISFAGFPIGFPRNTVEYKWLVNGDHYPALWVTSNVFGGTETISNIRYRDTYRNTANDNSASNVSNIVTDIKAYPNPAINGVTVLDLPADWKNYSVEIFDMQSRNVLTLSNKKEIDMSSFPAGNYVARVISGNSVAYVQLTR